ncbi:uncharacterized protein LOC128241093 [Mya arenaria]|uniref:uncharacterized protein LOC128235564 n=1 Tax=Mya arenaria TaxID=6604 RepID=UPI0022E17DB7|nr:uncharacterized protein LOC128235564 [Mya arenaria]XP_052806343.1 uncharacterized protein LOC128235570 [Mya arenaria]XP_052814035.1 uncharacterized protein LOC128241093 [Mya arenaria]
MTSPIGNFQQPFTYGMQQSPGMFQPAPPAPSTPPSCALQIMEDIKSIKTSLPNIEKTVNTINLKISDMDIKINNLESKVTEVETSCSFISNEFERQKTEVNEAKIEIRKLQQTCGDLKNQSHEFEIQKDQMNDKLLDLESRSMRDNLIFYGIQEHGPEENCDTLVKDFIASKLGIETKDLLFDRIHRLGSNKAPKPRPIVGKFHYYTDREKIRQKSYDEGVKKQLKEARQGVGVQRPQQTRDARKALFDIIKAEESNGKTTRLAGNKLYVNGNLFKTYVNGKVCDPPRYNAQGQN